MFSLIITIISIALVAALALATLYFGGDAFNQGSAKAAASTVVNQASQISGANTLFYLDNQGYAADVNALVTGSYLASAPNPGNIDKADADSEDYVMTGSTISLDGISQAVCEAVNTQAGLSTTTPAAAEADVTVAFGSGGSLEEVQFGCFATSVTSGAEAYTFAFK